MVDITDFLLLTLLSEHDYYAYEMIKDIDRLTNSCISVNQNTVYSALYRLKENGHINEYERKAGKRRKRIYYHLEDSGCRYLRELYIEYTNTVTGISNILDRLRSNDNE